MINRFADLKIGYDPANPEDWGIRLRLVVAITNAMDELFQLSGSAPFYVR